MDFKLNFVNCGAQQSEKDACVIEFSHRRRDDSVKQISLEVSF